MSTAFNPSRDGHALDKLRHTSPKINRMLNGVGSRAKQYAALAAMEGDPLGVTAINGAGADAVTRQVNLGNISARTTEENAARWGAFRGERRAHEALKELLDTHEKASAPTAPALNAEAANTLRDFQQRTSAPSQLDAMKRLVESHSLAASRAKRVIAQDAEIEALKGDVVRLERLCEQAGKHTDQHGEVGQLKARLAEMAQQLQAVKQVSQVTRQVVSGEMQDIALDFTEAFAGATMTADPSGEVVVALAQENLARLFAVWQRAVKALGIAKRGAA